MTEKKERLSLIIFTAVRKRLPVKGIYLNEKESSIYLFDKKEYVLFLTIGLLLLLILALLFFDNIIVCILMLPLLYPWMCFVGEIKRNRRQLKLSLAFKDGMDAAAAAIYAGYSVENAFWVAYSELTVLYGEKSDICTEFKRFANASKINMDVYELLIDFSDRSGLTDVRSFAYVFDAAQKSGGHMVDIINESTHTISEKIRIKDEINTAISSRLYEMMIMMLVPSGILIYLRVAAYEFINVLYTTFTGRIVMLFCLLVYVAAFALGVKICRIEV